MIAKCQGALDRWLEGHTVVRTAIIIGLLCALGSIIWQVWRIRLVVVHGEVGSDGYKDPEVVLCLPTHIFP